MEKTFMPYKVLVYFYDCGKCTVLEGFGTEHDSYIWANTAKRLIKEHYNLLPEFIEVKDVQRLSVDDVPDEIKSGWNFNIGTVPCYVYEFHTGS